MQWVPKEPKSLSWGRLSKGIRIFFGVHSPYRVYRRPGIFFRFMAVRFLNLCNRARNRWFSSKSVECNFCGWAGSRFDWFTDYDVAYVRSNARCPRCGSMERHRTLLAYLEHIHFFSRSQRLLDIGPRKIFQTWISSHADTVQYVSVDAFSDEAMIRMDVQRLGLRSETFDTVICYHVLEHVEDDASALSEIHRVLRLEGIALIQVPLDVTRLQGVEYLEPDPFDCGHRRRYGLGLVRKMESIGFHVDKIDFSNEISQTHMRRLGLNSDSFFKLTKIASLAMAGGDRT